jgi:OPA family sugar phosphate sensor protein UhpC-like MFS transporter
VGVINSISSLLRAAPHAEEIKDPELVKKQYKYWRFRIFYSMYFGYVLYYFTRKGMAAVTPALKMQLGFDEVQIGNLTTVFALAYGISKFTCGVISDRSNPRYFMGVGLLMTGVCNLCFGMSSSLMFLMVFWGFNGWFQGTGWPPCARLLTHWYSQTERGTWWGIWNTSHNVGGFLIPYFAAACMAWMGWRYALYLPGVLGVFMGLFLLNRLRDTPQSLGLPSIEKFRNEEEGTEGGDAEFEISLKERLVDYVLTNKYVWTLAIAYFFVYVVRQAVDSWTVLYFTEVRGYEIFTANMCYSWFEVGGFFGSLFAGWGSDKIFKGKRGPINVLFSAGIALVVPCLWLASESNVFFDSGMIFILGFLIFGPQMLIGVAAAELSHKKAAATATGFAGLFAYLGAAAAGAPLGMVIRDWGWDGFFMVLTGAGVLAALILLPLWSTKKNPKFANR